MTLRTRLSLLWVTILYAGGGEPACAKAEADPPPAAKDDNRGGER
jgi:hypothetical protein